jgi:hypothetical protein
MSALRHSYASVLLDAGGSIKAPAAYLGHSDPGFTLVVYTHLMRQARSVRGARSTSSSGSRRRMDGPGDVEQREALGARHPLVVAPHKELHRDSDPGTGPSRPDRAAQLSTATGPWVRADPRDAEPAAVDMPMVHRASADVVELLDRVSGWSLRRLVDSGRSSLRQRSIATPGSARPSVQKTVTGIAARQGRGSRQMSPV